jgi:hypothetical protein
MMNTMRVLVSILATLHLLISPVAVHAQDAQETRQQIESGKLVSPEVYTQAGFTSTEHAQEFAEWRRRFIKDRQVLLEQLDKPRAGSSSHADHLHSLSANAFVNSIDQGKKGISLINFMIEDLYVPAREGAGMPKGVNFSYLIERSDTRAVGYGGKLQSDGSTVELWYVVFHDVEKMTNHDLRSTAAFQVFKPLALPKLNEAKRDSWPSMVFIRDPKGRLMLWAMSAEQYKILDRMEWNSLM